MKIGWGIRITILYCCFVALILTMVIASNHQHFDLVSANYYADEIAYQKVIDAGENQARLSSPVIVHANDDQIVLDLPVELRGLPVSAEIQFYSPVNAAWDRKFDFNAVNNSVEVSRNKLYKTRYTVKISITAKGKKYYQESDLNLNS